MCFPQLPTSQWNSRFGTVTGAQDQNFSGKTMKPMKLLSLPGAGLQHT